MKLAFCLYKYFPYGGLQRDFMRIALDCQRRGHEIRVYTLSWAGEIPKEFEVVIVPVNALTNHTRYKNYSDWVQKSLQADPVDCVVGINKMPGLDIYYAADSCYEEKAQSQRGWLYRQLPRYEHFAEYERAVFGEHESVEVLMISETQKPFFKKYYGTPESRMHFLPPGISHDRIAPENAEEVRQKKRRELNVADDEKLVLMVGSGFIKKGLRRALYAIKFLDRALRQKTWFYIIGEDNQAPFKRLALLLGISDRVVFMSGRDDVPAFMLAGDLLLHPAMDENAGIVLLEAIVSGLPVLATDICGYGHYIEEAGVGELVPSPFKQSDLNQRLQRLLMLDQRAEWWRRGKVFAETADIYSLPQEASRIVEQVCISLQKKKAAKGEFAFCLFKYFPYGGLQRDFIRVALQCRDRGYTIRVYTLSWQGEIPEGIEVVIVPVTAITNHKRYERYWLWVEDHIKHNPVNGVVGFNKMPGLDIYYAADSCYEDKAQTQRGQLYRAIPRYKHFSNFERAVFEPESSTRILMISEVQKPLFQKYYGTPLDRFHLLPPGISRDRIAPDNSVSLRQNFREEFSIEDDEYLLLMVGSGFITKGLDRILLGISSLPPEVLRKTRLMAVGQDNPNAFLRMAKRLHIEQKVTILSGRDDIPRFLLGADLLVHPAYVENTGTVLLEAMVAGLPVLATDVCGYAHYIKDAGAGRLVPSPFDQTMFDKMLLEMLLSDERPDWQANGVKFGRFADIYSMPERAADEIVAALG
ncbi:MAG: UDP-glucose:(heptosyl)LPS alpha-1,3-glucosyltransferase [Candidatus Azotimanducaceae bacterium]|jgi:UDP-glucose:(heptosyl)LPS alpha-1,3-glucosyltransferase